MSEMAYEYDNFAASTSKVVDGVYIVKHGITYKIEVPVDKMRFTKRINVLTGEVYYPSNADRIRSMTDEELAEWIAKVLTYHTKNVANSWADVCDPQCPLYKCCNDQPYDNIEDWLKATVEEVGE